MANYTNSKDLVDDILFRAGEPTDGTSDFDAQALQYLNRAQQALVTGGAEIDPEINEKWWWLRKDPPGTLKLEAVVDGGTANVTEDSTSVTMSAAPTDAAKNNVSVNKWFFKVDGHEDIFRVSAHTSGNTGVTLGDKYTGDTDTAANYKLFNLEYDLASDLIRVVSPMSVFQTRSEIEGMDIDSLENLYPLRNILPGVPEAFGMVTETKVRFSHYGDSDQAGNFIHVEYDYDFLPTDLTDSASETPVVPKQYRRVLADIGLYFLSLDMSDSRAGTFLANAVRGVRAMATENRYRLAVMGRDIGKIIPRQDELAMSREPLRTSSGLIIG